MKKNGDHVYVVTGILVGVSGFEPEASWTRTKRDTKLRHTPITEDIIVKFSPIVKYGNMITYNLYRITNQFYVSGGIL